MQYYFYYLLFLFSWGGIQYYAMIRMGEFVLHSFMLDIQGTVQSKRATQYM